MFFRKLTTVLPAFVLVLVVSVEAIFIYRRVLTLQDAWFLILLVVMAGVTLAIGKGERSAFILCLLLASLSVLFSLVDAEQLIVLGSLSPGGELTGRLLSFFWNALRWLFPFLFIHFALVFPVPSEWIDSSRRRVLELYLPYLLLLMLLQTEAAGAFAGAAMLLIFPAGFLVGLGIFIRQYLYSLTATEKSRLHIILIGCLVGALPRILSFLAHALDESALPGFVYDVTYLLLPLFPLTLIVAVLKKDFCFSARFYSPAGSRQRKNLCSEFQPIRPNPYIVGNPIRSPEMFFGREEEFQSIRSKLEGESEGCAIVLFGERRTGKTSILYQLLNGRLGSGFVPVFIDMQGAVVQKDQELLSLLASKLSQAAPGSDGKLQPMIGDYLQFNAFSDSIMERLGQRRLLLLIDEYELIESKVKEGKINSEVFGYFKSLLERYPRLSFVFTGSRSLEESDAWTELLQRSIYRRISFLHRRDAEQLICTPLQGKAFFTGNLVHELLRFTSGHPFFTQLLCQSVVEVLNERRTNLVDRKIAEESVQRILDNPPPQLFYQWATLTEVEKLMLSALATVLKGPNAYASADRVARLIASLPQARQENIDSTRIRMHFEELRHRSLLDRDQTRYRFTMDLLRLWIQSEHNIWKVLKECYKVTGTILKENYV